MGLIHEKLPNNDASLLRRGPLSPVTATAAAVTYTAQQVLGGLIRRDTAGAARADVLPNAGLIAAEMALRGIPLEVGQCFEMLYTNESGAANASTLTASADGTTTVVGLAAIPQAKNAIVRFVCTALTPTFVAFVVASA